MSLILVSEARARGIALPADDLVAQDIIDEQEAWLAQRIGLLTGSRTQTFYVGIGWTHGKLGLARYTDAVTLVDGGTAVDSDHFRLVDRGSAVHHTYSAASQWWSGPYVEATYEPNDEDVVRKALFDLVALAVQPVTPYESETIGAYSYSKGTGPVSPAAQKAAIVSSLLPKHDPNITIQSRRVAVNDPVINRAEPWI